MSITFKPEQTMVSAANEKAFVVHRDGQLIGWAYFHERNGWRCVSPGRRGSVLVLLDDEGRSVGLARKDGPPEAVEGDRDPVRHPRPAASFYLH